MHTRFALESGSAICYNRSSMSNAGMQQGMKQSMVATAAMGQKRAYVYLAYLTAQGGHNQPADPKLAELFVRMAALDMKDEARTLYDKLMAEGWNPEP